ncbi:MAG: M20 family metallo-hydrolase [Tannerellaceae bacterium]|jgi:acetylornithine deacetylase|nr:M20 family metallo-hydrolase [Tannerellaceae bacterium]
MVNELYYQAVDTLKGLIAIPSFSRSENAAADYLENVWKADGMTVNRLGNNLWITSPGFDPEKPSILLNSHIDTVRPAAGWTLDPFAAIESEDGKLYGLGSNDAGGALVSLYAAFRILSSGRQQPYNMVFLASAEEEVSGANGIAMALNIIPGCSFAVVGEPTAMMPAIAEKGLMVIDCTAEGVAGHAARNEGLNAITVAMKDIMWFHSYRFPEVSALLGPVKMSVTIIQGGTQHNVVPDRCVFTVDIRSNECYSNEQILQHVKDNILSTPLPRSMRLGSSRLDPEHPFVKRAVILGREPFGSPTLSDQALLSFPSVKIGPGMSSRSHTADEYIQLDEIREAIDLYVRLLDMLYI